MGTRFSAIFFSDKLVVPFKIDISLQCYGFRDIDIDISYTFDKRKYY